jgi:hypothetical protein
MLLPAVRATHLVERGIDMSSARSLWGICLFFLVSGLSCGSADPRRSGEATSFAAPLVASVETSHVARASYYNVEATRYRDIANHARQLSAAYAQWTPPATATKNWNAILKARVDARAVAADQRAENLQALLTSGTPVVSDGGAQ